MERKTSLTAVLFALAALSVQGAMWNAAASASAKTPVALSLRPLETEIVVTPDAPKTVRFAAEEMQAR